MSVTVTTYVFEHSESRGNDRLVLHAIADEANDDGTNAFPGIKRIAHKVRLPERTVMRCLDRLETAAELEVIRPEKRGRGHHNTYRVLMEKGDKVAPFAEPESPRKAAEDRAALPNPSQTHRPIDPTPKEPKEAPAIAKEVVDRAWKRKTPRPATPYVAALKIVEKLLGAGWPARAVEEALVVVPTISTGWLEGELRKRHGGQPRGPGWVPTPEEDRAGREGPEGRIVGL